MYLLYVSVNPFQQLLLILQTIVKAEALVSSNFTARKETVRPDPVVKVHDNHIHFTSLDKAATVIIRIRIAVKSASLDKDKHWEWIGACCIG
jgi:hypothetical protein